MIQCIAPSIAPPFEDGPNVGRKFPTLPDISGVQGMNCPLIPAYSSRGQEYTFPPELLDHNLADLHGAHQGIDRMQHRQEMQCIGLA